MTPEQIFAEINRNLNLLMEHEGYDFGFREPDDDERVGSFLLGRFNEERGRMDVLQHLRYDEDTGRYEAHQGDPDDTWGVKHV